MSATANLSFDANSATLDRRLWLALVASVLAHWVALIIFAGLLLPLPLPVWVSLGQPAVVEVVLASPEPPAVAPEPDTPVDATKPPLEITPALTPVPSSPPPRPAQEAPTPVRRTDPNPPAAPLTGAAMPVEPLPDAIPDDTPIPPGDVAVGAAESSAVLGTTQALRLAQRFPNGVDTKPRLLDPLVVPYPPRAARAHREARVSALLIIDADGKVLETTLLPDEPLFGPTVRDALAGAKFKAAEAESRPVPHWIVLEFVFKMRPVRAPRFPASN